MTGIVAVPGIISARDADLIKAVTAGIVPEIRAQFQAEMVPLLARIDALEQRELVLPEQGEQGPRGEPGPAGEVDMEAVREIVAELTQQAVSEQLPDVIKAVPIPDAPAPIAPDMEAIEQIIRDRIERAISKLPAAKDGVGLADALIDKDGALVLTLTDGRTKSLGVVMGKDGRDGKDGAPGETFTLDDFDIVPLDERTIKMGFTKGDVMHSFELAFPVPVYRGVFRDAETYERGDMTTWAGSLWHCNEPKGLKPGAEDSGWQLAAKAGRPGKDAAK
jgi:hypothetical protein